MIRCDELPFCLWEKGVEDEEVRTLSSLNSCVLSYSIGGASYTREDLNDCCLIDDDDSLMRSCLAEMVGAVDVESPNSAPKVPSTSDSCSDEDRNIEVPCTVEG